MGSRSYGIDVGGQAFASSIRDVWQALDSERSEWNVERMQFGRTKRGNYIYITFYYIDNLEDSDELIDIDPIQKILELRDNGKLDMLSPLDRLALAQDLTMSTSLHSHESYESISRHVSSLQGLFKTEQDVLNRLKGHEGKTLRNIVNLLREMESDASFSVMRMQNIDRIRNDVIGFKDVFGLNVDRVVVDESVVADESMYSVENFAYVYSCFLCLLHLSLSLSHTHTHEQKNKDTECASFKDLNLCSSMQDLLSAR